MQQKVMLESGFHLALKAANESRTDIGWDPGLTWLGSRRGVHHHWGRRGAVEASRTTGGDRVRLLPRGRLTTATSAPRIQLLLLLHGSHDAHPTTAAGPGQIHHGAVARRGAHPEFRLKLLLLLPKGVDDATSPDAARHHAPAAWWSEE